MNRPRASLYGYSYIKYSTAAPGEKRGYVPKDLLNTQMNLITQLNYPNYTNASLINISSNVAYAQSGGGKPLKCYRIGNVNAPNVMILNFAIHGYEDYWKQDGYELFMTALNITDDLQKNLSSQTTNNWCIYIIPTSNPDGILFPDGPDFGNCDGKGRQTTTMFDINESPQLTNGADSRVDLNRCFPYNLDNDFFPRSGRNNTGPNAMMAYEALALNDIIQAHKNASGAKIFIDNHGWLQQIITNDEILRSKFKSEFKGGNFENNYYIAGDDSRGYVSRWANANGYTSCLFEFPTNILKPYDIQIKGSESKYIKVIKDILANYNN